MKKILKKIKLFALSALILLASFIGVQSCGGVNVLSPKVATASAETVTPAQVSDLTDTTWLLNESPTYLQSEESFEILGEINYTINSTPSILNTNYVDIGEDYIWFREINGGVNVVTTYFNNEWSYYNDNSGVTTPITGDIFLTVTGGEDATNATLIAWFENNATLISGGEPTIDDLTGVGVLWNDVIDYTLGEEDAIYYDIYFYSSDDFETLTAYNSLLLELYDGEITITYIASESGIEDIVYITGIGWVDESYQYIYIGGGADATNEDLLQIIFNNSEVYYDGEMGFWLSASNRSGYVDGYALGLVRGLEEGDEIGYRRGLREGQEAAGGIGKSIWDNMFTFFGNIFDALTELLSIEIVPSVNIALVTIGIPMIIWAIGAIIRLVLFFFGGA